VSAASTIVSGHKLVYRYAGAPEAVLDGLSLEVFAGHRVGLMGASGIGKSTLIRLLSGLRRPDEGSVERGFSFPEHVGFLLQRSSMFPSRTIRENVQLALPTRMPRLTKDHFARFELDGLEESYPAQLSGGQLRRACIMRALVHNPRVLFLDEPFVGLDEPLKTRLYSTVLDSGRERTVLFVTHNPRDAFEWGDRVLHLDSPSDLRIFRMNRPGAADPHPNEVADGVCSDPGELADQLTGPEGDEVRAE